MAFEPLPAAKRAADQGERFHKAADSIRARTETTAKGLAAVGTAAVTAIGYAKFADIFPYGGPCWSVPALVVGVAAMIAAVVMLVLRFQKVSEPIRTGADLDKTFAENELSDSEQGKLASDYQRVASLNEVRTLLAYEARAHRFERIADRAGDDENEVNDLRADADVIRAEVLATQERAVALILRERAKSAFFSLEAAGLLLLFVLGWYGTALAADAMQSERDGKITVAKTCAEARALSTIDENELPSICGEAAGEEEEPTASEAQAGAVTALATALGECWQQAEAEDEDLAVCSPLQRALAAAREEG